MGYFFCVTYKAISRLLWGYFKRQWSTSFLWHIYFIIVGVHRDKEYFFTLWALLYFYPLHCSLKDFDTELLNYISFNKSDPLLHAPVQSSMWYHFCIMMKWYGTISFREKMPTYKQCAWQNTFVPTTTQQFHQKLEAGSLRRYEKIIQALLLSLPDQSSLAAKRIVKH